ncbi:hypothetical protein [Microvirga aerophila]|nr:hypothetical protein [Microvirga aerophila]
MARLDELGSNVAEAGLLDDLRSELATPVVRLKRHLDQRAVLTAAGITVEQPASLSAGQKRAAVLLERFMAEKKAATLKKGRHWTQLLEDIEAASNDVAKATSAGWRAYRQELFGGDNPSVIRSRLAMTNNNMTAFKRYETLYQEFRVAFDTLPQDAATVTRIKRLAAELAATAKSFDFDVPAEVKAFLEAVQTGGAPLALLTDTVQSWLKANSALDSYRVWAWNR